MERGANIPPAPRRWIGLVFAVAATALIAATFFVPWSAALIIALGDAEAVTSTFGDVTDYSVPFAIVGLLASLTAAIAAVMPRVRVLAVIALGAGVAAAVVMVLALNKVVEVWGEEADKAAEIIRNANAVESDFDPAVVMVMSSDATVCGAAAIALVLLVSAAGVFPRRPVLACAAVMTVLVAGVFSTPAVLSWGVTDSGAVRHDGYYTTVAEPLMWLALLGLVVLMWISALVRPPVVKLVLVVVGLALMVSGAFFEYPLDDEQWIPREALVGYEPDLPSATTVGQAGGVFAFPAIVALLAWSWIRAVRQRRTRQTAHVPSAGTPMGAGQTSWPAGHPDPSASSH